MWVLFVKLISPAPWFLEPKPRSSAIFSSDVPDPLIPTGPSTSPATQPHLGDG